MSVDATNEEKTEENEEVASSQASLSEALSVQNAAFSLQAPSQQAQRRAILTPDNGGQNDDGKWYDLHEKRQPQTRMLIHQEVKTARQT